MTPKFHTALCLLLVISSFAFAKRKKEEPLSPIQQKAQEIQAKDFTMSANQLRVILQQLTGRYGAIIEHHADSIIDNCADKEHKAQATQWKLTAIPTLYKSLFYNRPLIGLIDAWAYSLQMKYFFESPRAGELYGEWSTVGLRAANLLENEIVSLAQTLPKSGNVDNAQRVIDEWAAKNPLVDFSKHRKSIILFATQGKGAKELTAFQSLGKLNEQLDDIIAQMTVYGAYIPKGVQWQSELILQEIGNSDLVDSLSKELSLITSDVHSMERTFGSLSDVIARERRVAVKKVEEEREIALATLEREREIILDAIAQERKVILDAADSIRATATADAERISITVVDLIFKRLLQLGGVLFALGFVAAFYFKKRRA